MRTARMACRIPVCVGGLAAAASMAACSATAPQTSGTTASHTSAASSSTSSSLDQGALAAYTGMWLEYASAADRGEWVDPALSRTTTDTALTDLVRALYNEQKQGLIAKGKPDLHPKIERSTGTTADISDCAFGGNFLEYMKATGKLEDNAPDGNRLITAHVEYAEGRWRVTRYTVGDVGSC